MRTKIAALIIGVVFHLFTTVGVANTNQNWESRFTLAPGLNGEVFAMLSMGTDLYVSGAFSSAGVAGTAGIARWDGVKWNSVGGGIDGVVFALATDGTNIFAGGGFNSAGGIAATNVARWDGMNWSSLGAMHMPDGLNPWMATVHTLLWNDSNLYVGGLFTQAGGVQATNVARWDGLDWHRLGDGLGLVDYTEIFRVNNLVMHQGDLYATGLFHVSGETGVTNLARWTGTAWEQVGGGLRGGTVQVWWESGILSGAGFALNSTTDGLLVGGDFTEAGGLAANNIALWDGTNLSAVGAGCDSAVYRIADDGPGRLALGSFSTIGGIAASGIARWNGSSWSALGQGVVSAGLAVARVGTNLFVGGNFQVAGGQSAGHVARWSGVDWVSLVPGECTAPADSVADLTFDPAGNLYAAGGFQSVAKIRANGVAGYDGTNWFALGNGLPERNVRAIAVAGTNLYVHGYFVRPAAGITNLARWSGDNWVSLGAGLANNGYSPSIDAMAAGPVDLFVAGQFTQAGGLSVTNLARWDGNQWHSMNYAPSPYPPFNSFSSIPCIAVKGDKLYICERTMVYGTSDTVRVKKWESNAWEDVGSPFSLASLSGYFPTSRTLTCVGTNLFLTGYFVVTNEFLATNIACWNGSAWQGVPHPFGAGAEFAPAATDGTNLFVALRPYGVALDEIKLAKWDGTRWKTLGTGLARHAYGPQAGALAIRGRNLFVGGYFSSAGGKPADNLALWRDFPEVAISARGWQSTGHFGLRIHGGKDQLVQVQLSTNLQNWDVLGTQLPDSDPYDFEDLTMTLDMRRYYRLLLVP